MTSSRCNVSSRATSSPGQGSGGGVGGRAARTQGRGDGLPTRFIIRPVRYSLRADVTDSSPPRPRSLPSRLSRHKRGTRGAGQARQCGAGYTHSDSNSAIHVLDDTKATQYRQKNEPQLTRDPACCVRRGEHRGAGKKQSRYCWR